MSFNWFRLALAALLVAAFCWVAAATAQSTLPTGAQYVASSPMVDALPDAPSPVAAQTVLQGSTTFAQAAPTQGGAVAPKYASVISSTETAQRINAHDKVIIGLRDTYALTSLGGIVLSAGYEQLLNGQPNYGSNSTAFGKRVGAAAVRSTSDSIFVDSVFAPLFHEDPRYYAQGSKRSFGGRAVYAVTRVLVTKTDSGKTTVNAALLSGYAVTAVMTPLYYPQINRDFNDVASGYGGSLGGAAIGNLVSEFADPILRSLHLEKKQ